MSDTTEHQCELPRPGWEGAMWECPQCGEDWYVDVSRRGGEYHFYWCRFADL